jgi:hypothetical protein
MIQEKPIKLTIKQKHRNCDYQTPRERVSCSNCVDYVHDISVVSKKDRYKCLKNSFVTSPFALCKFFKLQS